VQSKENAVNTNLIHNVINWAAAIVAALSIPEVVALMPPELGVKILGALAVAKTIINVMRDGFAGMFKSQPPVQ
jgi:hypothetical protein